MAKAQWMWYPGDFERYHAMLVHNKREVCGEYYSPMWRVDAPHRNVKLYKVAILEKSETFRVKANPGAVFDLLINQKRVPPSGKYTLEPGKNFIKISAYKESGFPCIYCEGKTFASGSGWSLGSYGAADSPAGTNSMYTAPGDNPEVFKFAYRHLSPTAIEPTEGGVFCDFGDERMGKLILEKPDTASRKLLIIYGESREEALAGKNAILWEEATMRGKKKIFRSRAFRYIAIYGKINDLAISCDEEYLPVLRRGAFTCDNEEVNHIYEACAHTIELNTREGYYDGIKRDRWIWSGDAYQSYFVNFYLTADNDTIRRTARMLRGEGKMNMHINTIVDYTLYWIIALWEYYYHTGDEAFIREMMPETDDLWTLVRSRLDETGFLLGKRGDWTFVDWADTAKSGIVCAEQMLLVASYRAYAKCLALIGDDEKPWLRLADSLVDKVNKTFWREERGAYIDCVENPERVEVVTRHANIFALLFDVADDRQTKRIIASVIKNDAIPAITTPYFKFYELDAMCRIGEYGYFTDMLHSYWGSMLSRGATTIWEAYDPQKSTVENYAMYGSPYGKSLCHAWGASPIYLLGRYALGVYPTSAGYKTFTVEPCYMGFGSFTGRTPIAAGTVEVCGDAEKVTVQTDCDGGTLVVGGRRYPLLKGESLTVSW